MLTIIASTDLLPLGDQPTRVSVAVDRDLLKFLDPSVDSLAQGDNRSRANRNGEAATGKVVREVSMALFGAVVAKLQLWFGWPKHVLCPGGPEPRNCQYAGICPDYNVVVEDLNPRLMEFISL